MSFIKEIIGVFDEICRTFYRIQILYNSNKIIKQQNNKAFYENNFNVEQRIYLKFYNSLTNYEYK